MEDYNLPPTSLSIYFLLPQFVSCRTGRTLAHRLRYTNEDCENDLQRNNFAADSGVTSHILPGANADMFFISPFFSPTSWCLFRIADIALTLIILTHNVQTLLIQWVWRHFITNRVTDNKDKLHESRSFRNYFHDDKDNLKQFVLVLLQREYSNSISS